MGGMEIGCVECGIGGNGLPVRGVEWGLGAEKQGFVFLADDCVFRSLVSLGLSSSFQESENG